jgi:23S rRNA (adenine-N6)-dimethyltransferase
VPHQFQPDFRYSQNFLTSRRLVDRLLDQSSIGSDDLVVDVGAGPGLITERLARRCDRVIAIEKDPRLAARLRLRFARRANVIIHEGDFRAFPLPKGSSKVFASIPFNITAEVVARLTAPPMPVLDAYLVVQKEAAATYTGEPTGSLRAALLKPWFEPSILHHFRRADFAPAPQVDVVMLRLRKRGPPLVGPRDARLYRDFVTYCFAAWSRNLRDTLEKLFGSRQGRSVADSAGIRPGDTPTTVRFEQWLAIFETFRASDNQAAGRRIARSVSRWRDRQRRVKKVHRTRARPGGR